MIRHRRCPSCKKLRSVTSGKHRLEDRRWHDRPGLGRICWICEEKSRREPHGILGLVPRAH